MKGTEQVTDLHLITVDEIIDEDVGLSIVPWPSADSQGRLRFREPATWDFVVVGRRQLCEFISGCGHKISPDNPPPENDPQPSRRYLRVGDTFAARLASKPTGTQSSTEDWIVKPVYDLTVDAREVAKLAFYGAAVGTWTYEENTLYGLLDEAEIPVAREP